MNMTYGKIKVNNAALITVRTGSTRLPNKALLKINGKTTIEHLIQRIKKSKLVDEIILCTTTLPEDDVLCRIALKNNIKYYKGSEKDKLERWNGACKEYNIDFFVTVDGDDLFCEPELIDLAIKQQKISQEDFISADNVICGAFTYGISTKALKKVCEVKDSDDTEMMWVYFTKSDLFNITKLQNIPDKYIRKDIRMTLDYKEDFEFFKNIIEHFNGKDFNLSDIIDYIDNNPLVAKINIEMEKLWAENQLNNTSLKIKK